ncbi:MAG: DUF4183 domain-containing protein [Intestinimonas sp.]|jgi:hypothetical protein|nr:DUF4183 domain-containing protein [Intestinimonas sp.]
MPECNLPLIICRLSDKNGHLLDPFEPNAISFTRLCSSKKCVGTKPDSQVATILIKGYIVVYAEGKDMSPPIPFSILQHICIWTPEDAFLDFQVRNFKCFGVPVMVGTEIAEIKVEIDLDTAARSCNWVDILVQPVDMPDEIVIMAQRVYDCVCFHSATSVVYDMLLEATVSQYNALSNGTKKNYTNADELMEYGNTGILSPSDVSFYNLFVNGILQPNVNYAMSTGHLDLQTTDAPPKDGPVIISFVTFGKNHGNTVYVTNDLYVTISDGIKHIYTNSDGLVEYDSKDIPSPDEVSFFNLFINGVLQPKTNYTVHVGVLELTTSDVPPADATIILECLTIKDSENTLLHAEVYEYNARSYGNKIYTNQDELTMYGNQGISDPQTASYEHLFVNGVIQPSITYSVEEGLLTLDTTDAPTPGTPVTLQFVRVFVS